MASFFKCQSNDLRLSIGRVNELSLTSSLSTTTADNNNNNVLYCHNHRNDFIDVHHHHHQSWLPKSTNIENNNNDVVDDTSLLPNISMAQNDDLVDNGKSHLKPTLLFVPKYYYFHYLSKLTKQIAAIHSFWKQFIISCPTISLIYLLVIILANNIGHIECFESFNDLEQTYTSICEPNGINALGMESGVIPDSALSASSSYNEQSVGPQNARLNRELHGGAWCPSSQINQTNSGHEWIQINLTEPFVITKIATQGRFGNGMGVEFAEVFWLNYTRDGIKWTRWSNSYGEFDIQGNMDTYSIVENILSIPLVAITAIRLLPVSSYTRTCCLRFEIYGCPYQEGPISYSMMDGQLNGRFGDLIDHTYDGYRSETGFLSDGLGQLVDGIRGDDNYKVNKGFEWIGWKANTQSVVSITFRFADIRNFTSAIFHCHNMFTKDIQVFHSAQIWFSLDGRQWAPIPEDFAYMPDMVVEKARDVIIHLHHRIGRFIKFDFRFAAKWLLISEAIFYSNPINRGLSINELDFVDSRPIATTAIQTSSTSTTHRNISLYKDSFFFIGSAIIVALLIAIFIIVLIWLARKRKEKITGSEYTTVPMKDVPSSAIYCEPHRFHHPGFPNNNSPDPEYAVPDLIGNGPSTFMTGKLTNNSLLLMNRQPQPLISSFTRTMINQDDGKARYYASTDVLSRNGIDHAPKITHNTLAGNLNVNSQLLPVAPMSGCVASQIYPKNGSAPSSLSSNTSKVLKLNSSTPSTSLESYENTPYNNNRNGSPTNHSVPLIKDKEVSIIDGHFGYSKYGDCELGYFCRKNDKQLVMLKTLSSRSFDLQQEFTQEMNAKFRLSDQCQNTFARLYGYISKYDYLAMVIEYGDSDLKKFLRNCSPSLIRIGQLVEIARQIAEAMQDLHDHGFVHKDLAARNCLIYHKNLQIKITDTGASNKDYQTEYFQQIFPLRWMSFETIIQSTFTNKSDVFSFGVTLWEIMKYCQSLPHQLLSDEELLSEIVNDHHVDKICDSSSAFYNHPFDDSNDSKCLLQLTKPKDCPDDIYDLIVECTQHTADSRPEFAEIVHFLQAKSLSLRKL
uniref:Discoidin domain-containing receptor 2-like isoform X2 n=1 Tax=Dermatophagoides pteronyssinus TaxID=6956 RepID=A0A6P6Y4F6_DERPT|nr:discoidin domain-containing receptor 2-like isoform X2 [Dermatophagoides pteronyssinus]